MSSGCRNWDNSISMLSARNFCQREAQISARRLPVPELNWLYVTQAFAESWAAEEVLDWALHRFDRQIAMASGFGPEGLVLIDMAARLRPDIRVFTLDTGVLFPETYELMKTIEHRYGIEVERLKPVLTLEEQEREHGPALWLRTPDRCARNCRLSARGSPRSDAIRLPIERRHRKSSGTQNSAWSKSTPSAIGRATWYGITSE